MAKSNHLVCVRQQPRWKWRGRIPASIKQQKHRLEEKRTEHKWMRLLAVFNYVNTFGSEYHSANWDSIEQKTRTWGRRHKARLRWHEEVAKLVVSCKTGCYQKTKVDWIVFLGLPNTARISLQILQLKFIEWWCWWENMSISLIESCI